VISGCAAQKPVLSSNAHLMNVGLAWLSNVWINLWALNLTNDQMQDCRWVKPELVAQIEFTDWTLDGYLRHARFAALRNDKESGQVRGNNCGHIWLFCESLFSLNI
jgi:hypothetical protein